MYLLKTETLAYALRATKRPEIKTISTPSFGRHSLLALLNMEFAARAAAKRSKRPMMCTTKWAGLDTQTTGHGRWTSSSFTMSVSSSLLTGPAIIGSRHTPKKRKKKVGHYPDWQLITSAQLTLQDLRRSNALQERWKTNPEEFHVMPHPGIRIEKETGKEYFKFKIGKKRFLLDIEAWKNSL